MYYNLSHCQHFGFGYQFSKPSRLAASLILLILGLTLPRVTNAFKLLYLYIFLHRTTTIILFRLCFYKSKFFKNHWFSAPQNFALRFWAVCKDLLNAKHNLNKYKLNDWWQLFVVKYIFALNILVLSYHIYPSSIDKVGVWRLPCIFP